MYDVRTGREIKPRENSEPLNLRNHSLFGFAVPVGAPKVNTPLPPHSCLHGLRYSSMD